MSVGEDLQTECPLCMELLEMDDMNFFPCTCGYQICRFCWHRIRTDENGLCPACRKQYPEDPAQFQPLTEDELQRIKRERRQKDLQRKQKAAENRKHLANVRVVQKNLVFVVGLSSRLGDPEILKKYEYFGKFGKTVKVVINQSTSYAGAQGPSASAYVTYQKPEDALRAIQAVNNVHVDGRTLKASLGTTKYCSHFLRGTTCMKSDCMYLHELGEEAASFTKEEMQQGKHQEYEQMLYEQYMNTLNLTNHNNQKSKRKSNSPLTTTTTTTTPAPVVQQEPSYPERNAETPQQSSADNNYHHCNDKDDWPNLNKATADYTNSSKEHIPQTALPQAPPQTEREVHPLPPLPPHRPPGCKAPSIDTDINNSKFLEGSEGPTPPPLNNGSLLNHQTQAMLLHQQLARKTLPYHTSDSMSLFSSNGFANTRTNKPPIPPHLTEEPLAAPQIPDIIPDNSSTDWQAAFGFTSAPVQDSQEDDLGFDPVDESAKALADMIEKECSISNSVRNSSGLGMKGHMNHHMGGMPHDHLQAHKPSPPGFSSFGMGHPAFGGSKMMELMQFSQEGMMHQPQPPCNPDLTEQNDIFTKKDWQDGLRALLPNINISFGGNPSAPPNMRQNPAHESSISDLWDPAIVTSAQTDFRQNTSLSEEPHWMASLQHLTEETHNHRLPLVTQFSYTEVSESAWPVQSQNPPPGFHQTQLAPQLPKAQKLSEGLP